MGLGLFVLCIHIRDREDALPSGHWFQIQFRKRILDIVLCNWIDKFPRYNLYR
jgi:hypothetical protein